MATLLITADRTQSGALSELALQRLATRLTPDGVTAGVHVHGSHGVQLAILHPSDTIEITKTGCAVGLIGQKSDGWDQVDGPLLDAAHLTVRWDDDAVEFIGDVVGSRTLWFHLSDDRLVASTSQRAAVAALGSFEPELEARTWMFGAGNLGPGLSWDRRLTALGADGRLVVDRRSWTVDHRLVQPAFATDGADIEALRVELDEAIHAAIHPLEIDPQTWVLPLSGGADSRAIATSIARPEGLRAVTWGSPTMEHDDRADVVVARTMADRVGLEHRFVPLAGQAPPQTIFDRFVHASEGRSDHIGGYLDGMTLWKSLANDGIGGVIRGDQAFGWTANRTDTAIRRSVEAIFLPEVGGTEQLRAMVHEAWGEQTWPAEFERRDDESGEAWRDRLYAQFRSAFVLAPLTDVKTSYVEVASPLLARSIVEVARRVPDPWRTRKRLYREVIAQRLPGVPYATVAATLPSATYLQTEAARSWLRTALTDAETDPTIPEHLVRSVERDIGTDATGAPRTTGPKYRAVARRLVPLRLRRAVATQVTTPVAGSPELLALRLLIIVEMHRILTEDAALLSH